MKIEVGKFYRTKSGHKAKIYETGVKILQSNNGIVGAIFIDDYWKILTWNSIGVAGMTSYNIISEWVEKPKVNLKKLFEDYKWAAMDFSGLWQVFETKPMQCSKSWRLAENFLSQYSGGKSVPSEIFEFSGDWKDSLIEL